VRNSPFPASYPDVERTITAGAGPGAGAGAGPDRRIVCERCLIADTPLTRLRGLIGREWLRPGEGLLIRPASAIHTCFMRFPIDAVFCRRDPHQSTLRDPCQSTLRVVRIVRGLAPWRFAACRHAHAVLELAAGECDHHEIRSGTYLLISVTPPTMLQATAPVVQE
jgi:uncharacterized protein